MARTLGPLGTEPFRRVLSVPGAPRLFACSLFARIPATAAPTVLTLRVVLGLHRGFAASGFVAAMVALGAAVGSPIVGRVIDRRGARPVLIVTAITESAFFGVGSLVSYGWIVIAAFMAGAVSLPVFALGRLAVASLLKPAERPAGLSLDSMSIEVSFAIGPVLGVLGATELGTRSAMVGVAVAIVIAGVALYSLDPVTTSKDDDNEASPVDGLSSWLTPSAIAALAATSGATLVLSGSDIGFTAMMRSFGRINLLGVVLAIWCAASLVGGFVYGSSRRRADPLVLLAALAGLTIVVAGASSWWTLLLLCIPGGLLVAPLLSATTEVLARTPSSHRGRAFGLHTSALTAGNAAGAPLAGLAIDRGGPGAGFVSVAMAGLGIAAAALALQHWYRRRPLGDRVQPTENRPER